MRSRSLVWTELGFCIKKSVKRNEAFNREYVITEMQTCILLNERKNARDREREREVCVCVKGWEE